MTIVSHYHIGLSFVTVLNKR